MSGGKRTREQGGDGSSPKKARSRQEQLEPMTLPRTRRYHRIGEFPAGGPVCLVQLDQEDINTLDCEWSDLRLYSSPWDPNMKRLFPCLRVKPTETKIYGLPLRWVFAIPPAAQPWIEEITRQRRTVYKHTRDIRLKVNIFLEDLRKRKLCPYGNVTYVFSNELTPLHTREQEEAALLMSLLVFYFWFQSRASVPPS
jgi:hypothetical protein